MPSDGHLRPTFIEAFDAVGLFDVIAHLEQDEMALTQCKKMLKPGGYVIATVPAHRWLWSREDKIAEHKWRYNKEQLHGLALRAGLEIVERYVFVTLLPFLLLRTSA